MEELLQQTFQFWYETIPSKKKVQGKNYATGCSLDYEYTENHYRLIAVDLSRQKGLDVGLKAIQQIEFVRQ